MGASWPLVSKSLTIQNQIDDSSRKMRVLAHFTIHMVEIIQLYTDQPRMWLGFRHHPCSNPHLLIYCPRLIISSRSLAMRLARSMTESVVGGTVAAVFQRVTNTHSAFL